MRFDHRQRVWHTMAFVVMQLAASGQQPSSTLIRDTLYNADGTKVQGTVAVSWRSFVTGAGATVAASQVTVPIVDGVLSLALAPNAGASPEGTSYRVEYTLNSGSQFVETWIVPESPTPVSVSQVRATMIPEPLTSIGQSQVDGLVQLLNEKADVGVSNVFRQPQTFRASAQGGRVLGLQTPDGEAGVYFALPDLAADSFYTLPAVDGLADQRLTTDGQGRLFWADPGRQGGGSSAQLQSQGVGLPPRSALNLTGGLTAEDNPGLDRVDIRPAFGTTAGTVVQGDDPRLSNARPPLAHAADHSSAGADPLTPAAIGALRRTNDTIAGTQADLPVLRVRGAPGQSVPVQEWLDAAGGAVAAIGSGGQATFESVEVSSPAGSSVRIFVDPATGDLSIARDGGPPLSLEQAAVATIGGDVLGPLPAATVAAIQGRPVSETPPAEGQCLIWDDSSGEWTPRDCVAFRDSLTWQFPGPAVDGPQELLLAVPNAVETGRILNVQIVASATGTTATTFNIERCVSGCQGTSPVFAPLYSTDAVLGPSVRMMSAGAPDADAVAGGDLLRANLISGGAGLANWSVVLTYEYAPQAEQGIQSASLRTDCEAFCPELWREADLPPNPFGPPKQVGDACVCFGMAEPVRE